MTDAGMEKTSYGAFERFVYIFLIPAVFTIILSSVLLSFFGYDVFGTAWRIADSIPVLNKVIPDPQPKAQDTQSDEHATREGTEKIKEMLAQKDAELKKLADAGKEKDKTIADLQSQVQQLQDQLQQKTVNDEEYLQQIKSLAGTYASMMPTKAAPVLENLTIPELVLVLSQMPNDSRVKILEKMDPQIAAQASIQLKDVTPTKDLQIAALQARIAEFNKMLSNDEKLNNGQLAQTFAAMSPQNAAEVLLEMAGKDPNKAAAILTAMESGARSQIISAISDISKAEAAKLTERIAK